MHKALSGLASSLFALSAVASAAHAETPLQRGTYLMHSMVACGNCHTPRGPDGKTLWNKELSGQLVVKDQTMTAYAPNITEDKKTGIGSWTDAQIINAIRNGFRPNGKLIGPPMPVDLYRNMSDTDVEAIVSYLRTVKPVTNTEPKSVYKFPLPPAYGPKVTHVPDVARSDKVKYGKYLVTISHCMACHSPLGPKGPDIEHQMGAGGQQIPGPWGIAVSANITPSEDGIKGWSDQDIKNAITKGIRPDGSHLTPPMAFDYYANIKPEDLDAIVAYLHTIPPKPSPK